MSYTYNKRLKGQAVKNVQKKAFTPFIAALALFLILPLSCSKGYSRYLKLPADPVVDSELGWALVTTAYAHLKASPDGASADSGALRGGEVFVCRQRRIDPNGSEAGGYWYQYSEGNLSGWVKDRDVAIFASEELARASLAAARP
jgi:hypothetical protein